MASDLLLDGAGRVLRDGLSGLARRQQLIASNIANMDTPGYRPRDVPFESILQQEMGAGSNLPMLRTASMHLGGSGDAATQHAAIEQGGSLETGSTGVDVDYEMARLSEATVQYDTLAQLMAARISILKSAVSDGRQ